MPTADSPTIRESLLDEATRRFAAQGFGATSLQVIAEGVGIRKASLLYHFASKDALRDAVLERLLARWNALLPDLLLAASAGASTPRRDRFARVMEALTSFFLEDADRARVLLREILDRPDAFRALLARHVRPWIRVVADQLEAAKAEGAVHADADAEAYAVHVLHLVVGGVAVMGATGALLEESPTAAKRRFEAELMRIVRAAIFTHARGATPTRRRPTAKKPTKKNGAGVRR